MNRYYRPAPVSTPTRDLPGESFFGSRSPNRSRAKYRLGRVRQRRHSDRLRTIACLSPGFIGMVLAHPQRPAAYSALRLLVHFSASSPIFKRAVSKLHMDSDTQAVKTERCHSLNGRSRGPSSRGRNASRRAPHVSSSLLKNHQSRCPG